MVSEVWSGQEKVADGRTDRGHNIIRPVFDRLMNIMNISKPSLLYFRMMGVVSLADAS